MNRGAIAPVVAALLALGAAGYGDNLDDPPALQPHWRFLADGAAP